jgi:predicted dehydrogenase
MAEKVRVGIIGTSGWTDMMFLSSFKSHLSAEISAICGRNRSRAEEMAAKYDIPQVYTDYRALLEQNNLDAVIVATPDDLHYPMTMDALDAGLHVLCEKPMALNAQHAREMYEKAEAVGKKHMVLFTWRWQPHFLYLKQLVDDGYIGRCYHAQFRSLWSFGRQPEYRWRYDGHRSNGVVSDLGAHMIDFARWYIGDVSKVSAHLATFVDRPGPDGQPSISANDSAMVTLQFDNEAHAIIQVSAVAHQADRRLDFNVLLHGESGTLEAEHLILGPEAGATIRGARHNEEQFGRLAIPDELRKNLDEGELLDPYSKQSVGPRLFIDAILEDRPVSPDFYDGMKVQEVIDAALESHRNECWVSLM